MKTLAKTLLLTGAFIASNAFAMEASYDCVRAKQDRICNPCKCVRMPKCCDRDTVCTSCKHNYCKACQYVPVCNSCKPCGDRY